MSAPGELLIGDQVRMGDIALLGLATIYDFEKGGTIALLNQVWGTRMVKFKARVTDLVKVPRRPAERRS